MSEPRDVTLPAAAPRHGGTDPGAGPPLRVVPSEPDAAGASTPVRIDIGPSEWALLVPPRRRRGGPLPGAALPGPFLLPLARKFALRRIPGGIDPQLGRAVLHYSRGQTVIYCSADQITAVAARAVSALADQALGAAADHEMAMTVNPEAHGNLTPGPHPAVTVTSGGTVSCYVCADLITAEFAEILGVLWTAHAAHLYHLGRGMTEADLRPAPLTPAQLPPDVADFTGRDEPVGQLCDLLSSAGSSGSPATARLAVVAGPGGLGKTSLAVHAARRVRGCFPGGQLYVDLLGATEHPLAPADVLARFLRDLGVSGRDIPAGEDERAARYRAVVAGRQVLIVLDNARDAAQVRPLLPGTMTCAVLVTTRRRMPGLPGASLVDLDVLDENDALTLFTKIIGTGRLAAEPQAAAEVLRACAGLPLAIRICAARLAWQRTWPIRDLAGRLRDARQRLDEDASDLAVRASFQVSFAGLPESPSPGGVAPARALCLLGLWQGASISAAAAAALFGGPPHLAAAALEVLVDRHLLESATPDRYQLHDLLRVYAAGQALATVPGPDRDAAISRLLRWYVRTADAAATTVTPARYDMPLDPAAEDSPPAVFAAADEALAWYDSERGNLAAATRQASAAGWHEVAWRLPAPLLNIYERRGAWADCIATHRVALASARLAGNRQGEAWLLTTLGWALSAAGQDEGSAYLEQALAIRREVGDRRGEAQAANNLADAYSSRGRAAEAVELLWRARDMNRALGNNYGEGIALENLGWTLMGLGRAEEAIGPLMRAVEVFAQSRYLDGIGYAMNTLGRCHLALGRQAEAMDCYRQALSHHLAAGNRHRYAAVLRAFAQAQLKAGQADEGRRSLLSALAEFIGLGDDAQADGVRTELQSLGARAGLIPVERSTARRAPARQLACQPAPRARAAQG